MIRSEQQQKALEVWCRLVANALNDAGLDMRKALRKDIDIPWNQDRVKDFIWRPVQEAMTDKHSTTELNRVEPSEIYEVLNRHLSEKFGIHVPWPTEENR